QSFKNSTSIKYDLLLKGSATASEYGVSYQYSIVIDQQGIIQYYGRSNKTSEINSKIQELLTATSIDKESGIPIKFGLKNNYPNPFNPQTNIPFSVDKAQEIKLTIYNISGQLVRTLVNARFAKGNFEAVWNGKDNQGQSVSSGIYFSRLQGEGTSSMKQLILLK
ncbi:MAG: FlgD immunoglobulin-like domain containing protein, partial [Anaerolineae bacterium]|nr:FlgD immunoglobulin-like domain containing protein [Anaerolineae bacterium]